MTGLAGHAILSGFVLLSTGLSAQTADKSMTVMVLAADVVDVTKIDKETEKRLTTAIKDAEKKRKDLEKILKAQHGKKREDWPPDAQDAYYDVEEAEALANADYAYRRVKQAGLSDTVEDIKRSIIGDGMAGKKENVTIVNTRDEAQLIVEVNGRRSGSSGSQPGLLVVRDDQYWISFLVKPGPKLGVDRFAAVPPTYRFRRMNASAWRLAIPRPDSPEWRFEAYGMQRWGNAANAASNVIEDFIAKNYDSMLGSALAK